MFPKKIHTTDIDTFFFEVTDRFELKSIIQNIFTDEWIFFYFKRTENLTDDVILESLKKDIDNDFKEYGEYQYLQKVDDNLFDSVGVLKKSIMFSNTVLKMWEYYYSVFIFQPVSIDMWESYKNFATEIAIKGSDLFGRKHIELGFCEFVVMKNLGGNELILSCKKELSDEILKKIGINPMVW